ncbi:Glycosyl transferase family 2 [Chromobacterium violaceum]|uniref:glycosyltransferase family 2 protein n=1 Tax=Chromobacterium violaceum TaxID=536 RepID=UPI003CE77CEC
MQIDNGFYDKNRRPYYILTPRYTRISNGIRALHLLCHYLNKLGEEAYVLTRETDPELTTPLLSKEIVNRHKSVNRVPIIVYPEVIHGNPMNGSSVVRYVLNHIGLLGGPQRYDKSDMLVYWAAEYVDPARDADPSIILIPTVDTKIFNNENNPQDQERSEVLIYPGRYEQAREEFPSLFKDATVITQEWPHSHEELAALLRRGKVLYCFANSSIVSEALLCGCPIVFKETPFTARPDGVPGINLAFLLPGVTGKDTPEAIEEARKAVAEYQKIYLQQLVDLPVQLRNFIEKSQALPQTRPNELILPEVLEREGGVSPEQAQYDDWRERQALTPSKLQLHAERMETIWKGQPRFIILMPVAPEQIREAIKSASAMTRQLYKNWQLICVADFDAPGGVFHSSDVLGWLRIDHASDPQQLTQAYAAVIGALPCDWIAVLRPGTELAEHALLSVADYASQQPAYQAIYCDSDTLGPGEECFLPVFRPDFNLDLLRGYNYVGQSAWFRRESLQQVGAFAAAAGADVLDALLRIHDQYGAMAIGHVADVLEHAPLEKQPAEVEAAERLAVAAHLARLREAADILPGEVEATRLIAYSAPPSCKLSIIVADAGDSFHLTACLEAINAARAGLDAEVLVVSALARRLTNASLVSCEPRQGVPACFRQGADAAKGDYLLFIDSRVEITQADCIPILLAHAARPGVGAVAPRLLRAGAGTIWRGPLLLGADDGAATIGDGLSLSEPGHLNRLQVAHNPGGLLLDCLLVGKALYQQVGGIQSGFADDVHAAADFSFRIRKLGKWLVWTPAASAMRDEGTLANGHVTAGGDGQRKVLWSCHDPAYNRHLSLESKQAFHIDNVFSAQWNIRFHEQPRILAWPGMERAEEGRLRAVMAKLADDKPHLTMVAPTGQRLPTVGEMARLAPDVLLLAARFNSSFLHSLQEYRQHCPDVSIVLSIDDRDGVVDSSPRYRRALIQEMAAVVDRVFVPTEAMRGLVSEVAKDVQLF